jgi:hypothetical protein
MAGTAGVAEMTVGPFLRHYVVFLGKAKKQLSNGFKKITH